MLKKGKGGRSWELVFGYTRDELIAHLERQFVKGMSWDNVRAWHVDHIIPLASFDVEDEGELKRAWALTNLRPLWADENCKKGAKITSLL